MCRPKHGEHAAVASVLKDQSVLGCKDHKITDSSTGVWFCRFEEKENVSSVNNVKSSVQRGIRSSIVDQYPHIESYIDQILPKKDALRAVKW